MKKTYSIIFSAFFIAAIIAGCGKGKQEETSQTDTSATEIAPTPDRTFNVMATVTEIDKEKERLFIDHEKMEGYMEAMVMPFKVTNPAVFDKVKVGTRARFTIYVKGDAMGVITDVQLEEK